MSGKTKGSGLGARMAPAVNAVEAGFAAARGSDAPGAKPEVAALNIRLPREMHNTLRDLAHRDRTSINAILIEAASEWLAKPR